MFNVRIYVLRGRGLMIKMAHALLSFFNRLAFLSVELFTCSTRQGRYDKNGARSAFFLQSSCFPLSSDSFLPVQKICNCTCPKLSPSSTIALFLSFLNRLAFLSLVLAFIQRNHYVSIRVFHSPSYIYCHFSLCHHFSY